MFTPEFQFQIRYRKREITQKKSHTKYLQNNVCKIFFYCFKKMKCLNTILNLYFFTITTMEFFLQLYEAYVKQFHG